MGIKMFSFASFFMFWSVHCKKHKLLYMFFTLTLILLLRAKKSTVQMCTLLLENTA